MKKTVLIILAVILLIPLLYSNVLAKRLLPHLKPASAPSAGVSTTKTQGIGASVKFRGDRRAINVNFSNLGIASSVSYILSYTTRGTSQGASGLLTPSTTGGTASRELLFGTCSHGVCRYDSGITNAKFVVTTTLKNGKKVVKSFRLKV